MTRAIFWVISSILLFNVIFIPGFLLFSHVLFRSLEKTDLENKLIFGRDTIQHEIGEVNTLARDYANWTAMYEYVETHDMVFITENIDDSAQFNLNINLVAIINPDDEIVYSNSVDFNDNEIKPVDFDTGSLLIQYPELIDQGNIDDDVQGLLLFDDRILLVSSCPIVTSQHMGPSRGFLIFGRFLDAREVQKLTQMAHFELFTQSLDASMPSNEMQLANYVLTGASDLPVEGTRPAQCGVCHRVTRGNPSLAQTNYAFTSPYNDQLLGGYTLLHDIQHNPIGIMGIHIPRAIEQLEKRYSSLFLLSFMGLQIIAAFIVVNIMARNIKTEEKRDREYKLLRAVIDNVPEQIYAHDANGRFLLNNLRDAQMMGVDNPEELLGKNDFDFYPPELASAFQESEKRVIQSGEPIVDTEGIMVGPDGNQRWILTTKTPLRDNQGQIAGIVGVSRDITDRKQREWELEAIVTMSRALRSAETNTELLFMIFRQVLDMLNAGWGTLELIDPVSGDAAVAYSFGFESSVDGMRIPPDKGLNSYIHSSNKPYLDNNIALNPMILDILQYTECTAAAGAPMIAEEELIGFLWVGRKSDIYDGEVRLLAAMADIAANSIRRMSLHELTTKRLDQLTSLRKIDTSINSNKDLNISLRVLLDQTCTQLQADAADVLLCSDNLESLNYEIGQGFRTKLFDQPVIRMDDGPAGQAAQSNELVQILNLAELGASHPLAVASQQEGFVSYFAVPLLVRDEIKGVLEVFFRKEFIPDHDWINFLETLAGQAAIAIEQVQLFNGLQHSNLELVKAYDETIEGWVRALDLRDKETEDHSLRVTRTCIELAVAMGIEDEDLIHVRRGALLHDIGKVGVPDHILLKPGKLTDQEWVIMRGHPQLAYEMLSPINYLHPALSIPYCHHEKWDGSGYPRGLKGAEIPLAARIFAVIDVWDALSNDRPYRKAWSKDDVLRYLKEQSGSHFDPRVVETFINHGLIG